MDENLDQDLVVFVDESGDEKTMEVLDYFFYEGNEYAVLTDYVECEAEHEHCEECGHDVDAFIMRVMPVEDDQEEFIAIEDEALMDKLIEFVQNELYDGEEEDEEEEEEDGE